MNWNLYVTAGALLLASTASQAAVIDFETVPGSSPADKLAISNQYQTDFGVTFSLSTGGTPYLEQVGTSDSGNGFLNDVLNQYDRAATGYESQLGNYFLRIGTGGLSSTPVPSLNISYDTAVAAASAQIWDIDGHSNGTEQWLVEALDNHGTVIDSIYSPLGTTHDAASLDGKPWTWSFDHGGTADIYGIRLTFTGSKTSGIGLAFDNFSPSEPAVVPEPSTYLLFGIGLLALLGWGRRRRQFMG